MSDIPGWIYIQNEVIFALELGPDDEYIPKVKRPEEEGKDLTEEEEYRLMWEQVKETKGFDMDFNKFRYVFNYKPVDFDDNDLVIGSETNKQVIDRLSRKSLEEYNDEQKTEYEFVEVSKANYHWAGAGVMFFITFKGKDSSDGEPKDFQAKVRYSYVDTNTHITCDLKPEKKVHSIETAEKEGAKKARLTEEETSTLAIIDGA